MTFDIKPIDTAYKGRLFRSRLEARWAVFFDKAEILWEYEPEGYDTPAGKYLPDFRIYLRGYDKPGLLFEVKPQNSVRVTGKCVCPPLDRRWFYALEASQAPYMLVACGIPSGNQIKEWIELTGGLHLLRPDEPNSHSPSWIFGTCPCCDRTVFQRELTNLDRVRTALNAATAARFEYGKQGN